MKLLQDERLTRVLRPTVTLVGMIASVWHAVHAINVLQQSHDYKVSDPALSEYFWGAFQVEIATSLAALFAGFFAWILFRPRQASASAREAAPSPAPASSPPA